MDFNSKLSLEDQVKSAIAVLTAQIDSLREQVERLCETTGGCQPPQNLSDSDVEQKNEK